MQTSEELNSWSENIYNLIVGVVSNDDFDISNRKYHELRACIELNCSRTSIKKHPDVDIIDVSTPLILIGRVKLEHRIGRKINERPWSIMIIGPGAGCHSQYRWGWVGKTPRAKQYWETIIPELKEYMRAFELPMETYKYLLKKLPKRRGIVT
jgi:hypothetical protein